MVQLQAESMAGAGLLISVEIKVRLLDLSS
jgi:hypothetical protein